MEASRAPSTPSLLTGGGGFLCSAFAGSCLWGVKVVLCLVPPAWVVPVDRSLEMAPGFDCCGVPSWIEAVERVSGAFVWYSWKIKAQSEPAARFCRLQTLNKNKKREGTTEAVKPLVDLAPEKAVVVLSSHATIEENKSSYGSYDAIPSLTTL
ncbi:hypothetical protein F2Q69_00022119 [Brassica cretica]|uniref:Uncharacterized protein n=1 Tax=Brassica cretica TaxID=69181 RepID=A0A8S9QGF4_BRACR|nr:hypothetical protein F2Q69_00022119 [Brassica cretica]